MAQVNFKGEAVQIRGEIPAVGSSAPNFSFVKEDLSEACLHDYTDKKKIVMSVPSLDTGVCQKQTEVFNSKLTEMSDTVGIVISMDLPFAMKRFCEGKGVKNIINASDFRHKDFIKKYGLEIVEGPLQGLTTRAVFVIGKDNVIEYCELVSEVTNEPDYESAIAKLRSI